MKNLKMLTATACFVLFAAMAILSGCKKNDVPKENTGKGIDKKKRDGIGTNSAGDGKNDLLGYGYDLTGEFANSSAAKFSVINVDKLKLEQPTRVEWDLSSRREGVLIAGENATSYLEKVTAKLNSSFSLFGLQKLLLFKASISGTYSDSDAFSSKYLYSSYSHKIQQKRVKLNATNGMLRDYLTASFATDVQNETPAYIVSRYGTHVLTDIILGAKLEVLYRSTTTKIDRINASTAGVDVGVKAVFSINTGFTYDYNSTTQNFSQTLHYKTIGGEPSTSILGNTNIVSANPPTVNISAWENSSSLANAEMIDIAENGLIPIWDLIADPVKSDAVKTYVIQYLKDNEAKEFGDVPIYVYYNSRSTDHYFTPDNLLTIGGGGFKNEGIAFYAFNKPAPDRVPIYVYYNAHGGDHYFTPENKPALGTGIGAYINEGIAFYAYPSPGANRIPIYVYSGIYGADHYYTPVNQPTIGGGGFRNEGIAFYALL